MRQRSEKVKNGANVFELAKVREKDEYIYKPLVEVVLMGAPMPNWTFFIVNPSALILLVVIVYGIVRHRTLGKDAKRILADNPARLVRFQMSQGGRTAGILDPKR